VSKYRVVEKRRKQSEVWAKHKVKPQCTTTVTATMGDSADVGNLGKWGCEENEEEEEVKLGTCNSVC